MTSSCDDRAGVAAAPMPLGVGMGLRPLASWCVVLAAGDSLVDLLRTAALAGVTVAVCQVPPMPRVKR